jgi:sterol desaturase/sphingolipid hydroxylase (fatty acid hydroxylase superfamily)
MSKKKSASAKSPINWVSTVLFVLICAGLLILFQIYDNSGQYLTGGLSFAWQMQLETWRSLISAQSFKPIAGSLIIIIAIMLIEHFRPWRKLQKRFRKEFWLDVVYNILSLGVFTLIGGNVAFALIVGPFNYLLANVFNVTYPLVYVIDEVPMWIRIVMLVLASEFVSYWAHRLEHNVNFLWQIHKIHHSALELDVMNASRLHWLEHLWLGVFGYIALGIIGFNAVEIGLVTICSNFLCYFTHANVYIPIGKLKYIINSPQMHIWHHAIDIDPNRSVNYCSALSIWDWIYRTAYFPEKPPGDLKLGFENVGAFPKTFLGQFIYPFRIFGKKLLRIFIVPRSVNGDD